MLFLPRRVAEDHMGVPDRVHRVFGIVIRMDHIGIFLRQDRAANHHFAVGSILVQFPDGFLQDVYKRQQGKCP